MTFNSSLLFELLAVVFLAASNSASAQMILVPRGSTWKFYYNGPVPTNWNQPDFNDQAWPSGPAQLGYGEGDEPTVLFDDPGFEPTACYFRQVFNVTNRSEISSLSVRLVADDGAVVYLNGAEVLRRNMPSGPVSFETTALTNLEINENSFVQSPISPGNLRTGSNTIAVEVHQHPDGGDDCSFDLELVANLPYSAPTITITSPVDRAILEQRDFDIEVSANDIDGHVTRVDIYTNGVLLAETTIDPFWFRWTNPPAGRYLLSAIAKDDSFLTANSSLARVQIGDVTNPVKTVRGPYLQSGSTTNIVLRWRTDWFADSVVRYGTNAAFLDHVWSNAPSILEHELNLTELQPDTLYFYSIASSVDTFATGPDFQFRTSPTNARPVRIWAIGDSGTGDTNAAAVRDAYQTVTAGEHTDLWLMLGDNAYGSGSDDEYQGAVFAMYPALLRRTVLWPALGNHDAGEDPSSSADPYRAMFTLPMRGEAGGVPSGSELYYSFDYANIHLICLDSFLSDRSTNGPMLTWLEDDLAATDKDWIIAFWHHPPYSWGSHNSDLESELIEMRERALPILERYGVDLVLSGHSHVYERSVLIDGHYGYSWELQPEMIVDASSGCPDTGLPYRKPSGGLGAHAGTVYTVCGCSGQGIDVNFSRHPAMAVNHNGYGSLIIEIDGLRLTARFLRPSLATDDCFAIDKSAPVTVGPALQISVGSNAPTISWPTSNPAFTLQWANTLRSPQWHTATEPVTTTARRNSVALNASATNRYFRLRNTP